VAAPNPGLLAAMLKAQRLQGVLRWKVNFTESGFTGETNLAGWSGLWLDTSAAKSIQDFVDVAATESKNSSLVGGALPDLLDAIIPASEGDTNICIAWSGWQDLMKASPEAALEIAELLDAICQERSAVVVVCDSTGSFPGISELSQG
jgi:hypothetical protein